MDSKKQILLAGLCLLMVSLGCGLLSDNGSSEITISEEDPTPVEELTLDEDPTPVEEPAVEEDAAVEAPAEEVSDSSDPSVPDSWAKYDGRGMSIWLPDSFQGGNLEEDVNLIADQLGDFGPEFGAIAEMIKQNPELFAFWVFDSEIGDSGFLTNVNITTEEVPSAIDIEMYLDLTENQFPAEFNMTERGIVPFQDSQAGRMVLEFDLGGVTGKEVIYIIQEDNTIWAVTYATSAEEFDQRLPDFERSIQTFESMLN
jgi:serine/threonine-protein kinase